MTISDIFELAKTKGVKISYLNDLIGGYRGKLTECKNGKSTLSEKELNIIENYLLGNEQKENNPPKSELSLKIIDAIENCSESEAEAILKQIEIIKSLRAK